MNSVLDAVVERNAPIPTWFEVGGRADTLARPAGVEELRQFLAADPHLRVLGDGANLLVDDDGVGELVVVLSAPAFSDWRFDERTGWLTAGAGASLPKLITEMVRSGRSGLEGLAGIPATVGGAVMMNAGGAFGQIADAVARVHAVDRADGARVHLNRDDIDFRYRGSGLNGLIITSVDLDLPQDDPDVLRDRLKEVMEYKKRSQPMKERSAGCVFRNPTLRADLPGIGPAGERVSAGLLIDRAGCKGLSAGGASVSARHANFIVTQPSAKARDVITLMDMVAARVVDRFGVRLEPEVVIWRRAGHEQRDQPAAGALAAGHGANA